MIGLRTATIDALALLKHWDGQEHVIASDTNDVWNWVTELSRSPGWREQLIAAKDGRPTWFIPIIDPAREKYHYLGRTDNEHPPSYVTVFRLN